jgi:hypothetical protein
VKSTALTLVGVLLVLIGFFSPWIPHRAAGLALTGFEIGEWIKFVPEVRAGVSPVRRSNFYWPVSVAAIGLVLVAAKGHRRSWWDWMTISLAALLSLLPLPPLEEIGSMDGIRSSLGRLLLVASGMIVTGAVAYRRGLPARVRGAVLASAAGVGVVLLSRAFSAAEPIVEGLLNRSIDPGLGYNLTRAGMVLLIAAGLVQFREK